MDFIVIMFFVRLSLFLLPNAAVALRECSHEEHDAHPVLCPVPHMPMPQPCHIVEQFQVASRSSCCQRSAQHSIIGLRSTTYSWNHHYSMRLRGLLLIQLLNAHFAFQQRLPPSPSYFHEFRKLSCKHHVLICQLLLVQLAPFVAS